MYPKSIKQYRTFAGMLVNVLWLLVIIVVISGLISAKTSYVEGRLEDKLYFLPFILCVGVFLYELRIRLAIKWRKHKIALYAGEHNARGALLGRGWPSQANFYLSSLDDKPGIRNANFTNVIDGDDWHYADFSYDIFKKTKYGEYRAITVYYSVISTKLPRSLPRIFFDSFKARKRQFRLTFSGKQLHSFEGDFDKHFATYFPYNYHIDNLSFLTPEVLWALRAADDYDIEIVGDQLYLYGDLRDPATQIPEMAAKLTEIKQKLLHNIVTYRDERLPYEQGRQSVAGIGTVLWRNMTKDYVVAALGLVLLAVGILVSMNIHQANPINQITLFGGILAGTSVGSIIKETRRRRKHMQMSDQLDNHKTGL